MELLSSCPWCGGNNQVILMDNKSFSGKCCVYCLDCEAKGPGYLSKDGDKSVKKAIYFWNNRAVQEWEKS